MSTAVSLWPKSWDCTPSVLTLNGTFTAFNAAHALFSNNTLTGKTILNACVVQLTSSNSQLRTTSLSAGVSLVKPFWDTEYPLIFAVALSVTLTYVLFFISLMAHSKRPWLQRGAAMIAAISLTLVADLMFQVLQSEHYNHSDRSSTQLKNVRTNNALKALRIISNALLWLAQVQVLIRIFPRYRDKVVIKWTGLCLIVLETVFEVLNDFFHPSTVNPNSKQSLIPAIPVLAYFFHIAIGVLYAVCLFFYTVSSGRWRYAYAFKNWLLAVASIVCVCSPVVFFCLDIWNQKVDGWGDYVRWCSSVAALVIAWDWVDQIETLIQKDTKTGILGREVFEEEMHDGKQAKTSEPRSSIQNRFMKLRWRKTLSTQTNDSDQAQGFDLPIIQHPLARSLASTGVSNNSAITQMTSQTHQGTSVIASTLSGSSWTGQAHQHSSPELRRDLSVEHAKQYTNSNQARKLNTVEPRAELQDDHQRPSQASSATFVHHGFTAGDYWQDEKSVADEFAENQIDESLS